MADSGLALEEEPEPVHIEEEKELSEEKSEFSVASEEESESKEESEGSEISEEEQEEQKDLANEIECQRQKLQRMKEALKLAEEKLQQLQIKALGESNSNSNSNSSESFPGLISSEMEVMGRRHLEKMTKQQLFMLLNHHDDKASQKTKKADLVKYILSKGYHESYAMPLAQFFSKENSDKGIFEGIFFEKSIKKKKANDSGDEDSSSS
jgi:hypothetical protein